MATLRKALIDYFTQAGIRYQEDNDLSVVIAGFTLRSGDALLICYCREEAYQLIVRVLFPFRAPSQHQSKVAEFITRVNYLLTLGCFELDYSDGELAFRIGIDVEDDRLTPALVRNLVGCALTTADHFYKPLAAVALSGLAPIRALEAACGQTSRMPTGIFTALGGGLMIDPCSRLN